MSLSSLIVQREIATIREIEEALARQVLYGGDFVTNLLEVSRIEEDALMPVVAESFGLEPAPPGELPKVPEEAARLVAAEVAAERMLAPLAVGASLVVAVAEPLPRDVEQELTFALALPIEQRIAPLFRIRQALARDYGIPIDKRIARLITKVIQKGPRIASTFPPPLESQPRLPARPPSIMPPPAVPSIDMSPRTTHAEQGTFVRTNAEAPVLRPVRRRRGPLTSEVANQELEASAERDVIFDVLFEFARQFFDYTALFIVHGDIAEGRDAFGDGASRDKVARVGVPLDLPNLLSTARQEKKVTRSIPSREGLDPVLMTDLQRDGTTECVVFPIVVRKRVVGLVLGDGGTSGIDDASVREVELLVQAASGAFERVIVRRKLKGAEGGPGEGGVAGAVRKAQDSLGPPPTQVSAPPQGGPGSPFPPLGQTMPGAAAMSGSTAAGASAITGTTMPFGDVTPAPIITVAQKPSDRPAVEELAPPIRDLMTEPVSRVAMTTRNPTPEALIPDIRTDRPPPPANLLAVRRPSGRPIPREEEPDEAGRDASKAPSSPAARGATSSRPPPGSGRTKSGSHKRAEAPPLEFGVPSMPSVITESTFGVDAAERQLLAQIQGTKLPSDPPKSPAPGQGAQGEPSVSASASASASAGAGAVSSEPAPRTTRDPSEITWQRERERDRAMQESSQRDPSSPPHHPWADADMAALSEAPHSPKAVSPPPMPVAAPITDMSPQPIVIGAHVGPIGPINPPTETLEAPEPMLEPTPSAQLQPAAIRPVFHIGPETPPPGELSPVSPVGPPPTLLEGELPTLEQMDQHHGGGVGVFVETDTDKTPIAPIVHVSAIATPPEPMKPVVVRYDSKLDRPDTDPNSIPEGSPADPVLSLAQRKGMPPVIPSQPEPKPMPASEQQVSVPAHKPPSSRSDHERILPSVIVDVSTEYVALVDRVLAGPDEDAETDLLRAGGYAMPAIMAKFPGPIAIEPDRLASGPLPRVAECGPVIRLIASQRRTALPFVLSHVGSQDLNKRFWATYLLTELLYPDAIDAALERVHDEDVNVRRAARAAVRALAEVHTGAVIDRLADRVRDDRELWSRRAQAVEALGESREPSAIPVLLGLLDDPAGDVTVAARNALVTISRQDFGLDEKKWTEWWEHNKHRHRLEWLIDSLMHDQRALRAAASDELKTITKEYFAYYDDLPKRERERSQARYREWWENIGRVRFSRAATRST